MASKKPQPVKIPTIRQLPSGAWTCQIRIGGAGERQSISITDDDYDTVYAKAYAYKTGILKQKKTASDITVGEALRRYIDDRKNTLSPSTLRGYEAIARNRFISFQKRRISTLTQNIIQQTINAESAICAPKTVKNAYRLIESALSYAGAKRFNVKLSTVPPSDKPYLLPEQIVTLLEYIKGHDAEVPVLLALWSCRRSEIYGLHWDNVDLKKRTVKICEAMVMNEQGEWVIKPMPKNDSSVRTIPICDQLCEALERIEIKTDRVVNGYPNSLHRTVNRICAHIDLPKIGAHGLRHSFASLAYHLGIPPKVAMAIGGWKNDHVMLGIYTHVSQSDIGAAAAKITQFFNQKANKKANKNQDSA